MSEYKIFKDPNYSSIYQVHKKCFGFYWILVGHVSAGSADQALSMARDLVKPPIEYFEA